MRIEVDQEIEKKLDAVKTKKWISGKGHTGTICFLLDHYEQTQSVEQLIDQKLSNIEKTIEQGIFKGFKRVLQNILGGGE
jgi:hypothetical protein